MAPTLKREVQLAFTFLLMFIWVDTCTSHLCLISPAQRGSLDGINEKGNSNCFQVKSPCGSQPPEDKIGLRPGQNLSITFQKNLDHWTSATPGYFQISISQETGNYKVLTTVLDKGEPSLHMYTSIVTIPNIKGDHTIQATYVTKNPKAPAAFYQCADVFVGNF